MATYDWFEIDMRDGREAGSFKTKAPRTSDWPEEWIHGRIIPRHYLMASLVLLPSNCRRKTPNKIIWRWVPRLCHAISRTTSYAALVTPKLMNHALGIATAY